MLIFARSWGIFLGAIGVIVSLLLAKVADALTMLLQFYAIMGVVVRGGVLWRRANSKGTQANNDVAAMPVYRKTRHIRPRLRTTRRVLALSRDR